MQTHGKYGKMLTVRDGYLECPTCRRNKRMMQILPNTSGRNLVVFCRDCKTEHIVDIVAGSHVIKVNSNHICNGPWASCDPMS